MRLLREAPRAWGLLALVVLLWSALASADPSIAMDYCATVNTAQTAGNHSIYQSDGLCHDFCNAQSYALAIVQSEYCWCSNYVPDSGSQESTSKCASSCPGYPSDYCGGDGTYGYMLLNASPSGTKTATPKAKTTTSSKSSTSSSSLDQVTATATVRDTVTYIPTLQTSSTSVDATSSSTSTSTSTATTSSTTSQTPTVHTVTVGGAVQTVTTTPSAVVGSPNTGDISASHKSGGLSTGGAVGLAIGMVALAVAVVGGIVFWCLRRRRRLREGEAAAAGAFDSQRGSTAGMMQTPKSAGTIDQPQFLFTAGGRGAGDNFETDPSGRRRSGMLRPIDPRLDPAAAGIYSGENKSHDSVNTLRDDQDYSRKVHHPGRVLRAVNPDPLDDD